jgi:hypothetical protein
MPAARPSVRSAPLIFDDLSEGQPMQVYGAHAVFWLGGHEVPLPREPSGK